MSSMHSGPATVARPWRSATDEVEPRGHWLVLYQRIDIGWEPLSLWCHKGQPNAIRPFDE